MKYHYIVFGYECDYFEVMFKDAIDELGVEYIKNPIKDSTHNSFLTALYNVHNNSYLNAIYNIPGKDKWYHLYYQKKHTDPLCFVFLICWFDSRYEKLFIYLKQNYPNAKLVLYLEDIVASRPAFDHKLEVYFDEIITYDKGDSDKYNYRYYPTFMSKIEIPAANTKYDLCFIGVAKQRISLIHSVFDYLKHKNIKQDFVVCRKPKEIDKVMGIKYKKFNMSYKEYLKHVACSKCILEIMQDNATGFTLRTWEALLYNKKLLTNNKLIKECEYFNEKQFAYFKTAEDIDPAFFSEDLFKSTFDPKSISPINFFQFLDKLL